MPKCSGFTVYDIDFRDQDGDRVRVTRAASVPEYVFVDPDRKDLSSDRQRNRVSEAFRAAAKTAGLLTDVRTTRRFYTRWDADRTANVVSALDRRLSADVDTPVDTNAQNAPRETSTNA
jgi:hypothetical protein